MFSIQNYPISIHDHPLPRPFHLFPLCPAWTTSNPQRPQPARPAASPRSCPPYFGGNFFVSKFESKKKFFLFIIFRYFWILFLLFLFYVFLRIFNIFY